MKRKFISIFVALVLALSLCLVTAVPAAATGPVGGPFFTTGGEGTAGWSTEQKTAGEYSVKLWLPPHTVEEPVVYDEARIVFNYEGDLNSITGVSYQSYVIGGNEGSAYPFVVLAVDEDDDLKVDSWIVQFVTPALSVPPGYSPLENEWREIAFDGTSTVHVAGARTGLPAGHYLPSMNVNTPSDTLSALKGERGWGDFEVLEVKVMIGEFTGLLEEMTAYVDDITINEELYELEPSAGGRLHVNIPAVIGASVDPPSIDFGTITPPEDVRRSCTLTNVGTVPVKVTTEVRGDTVFGSCLTILNPDIPIEKLEPNYSEKIDLRLDVPATYHAKGVETGVLIFWLVETE